MQAKRKEIQFLNGGKLNRNRFIISLTLEKPGGWAGGHICSTLQCFIQDSSVCVFKEFRCAGRLPGTVNLVFRLLVGGKFHFWKWFCQPTSLLLLKGHEISLHFTFSKFHPTASLAQHSHCGVGLWTLCVQSGGKQFSAHKAGHSSTLA